MTFTYFTLKNRITLEDLINSSMTKEEAKHAAEEIESSKDRKDLEYNEIGLTVVGPFSFLYQPSSAWPTKWLSTKSLKKALKERARK